MTPYYRSSDGQIEVWHASIEALIAADVVDRRHVALLSGDPPYNVNGVAMGTKSRTSTPQRSRKVGKCSARVNGRSFEPIAGDDRPFDPAPLLTLDVPTALWGANHYCGRLPGSSCWLHWDKREDSGPDDGADFELAWTNLPGPARSFSHVWRGTCRASETGVPHLYATQKPVALMVWELTLAKLKPGDLVVVPYMGSGPELAAAIKMRLKIVACDVSREACRIATSARLGVVVEPPPVASLGPLFARSQ